ncbi:GspE/PulE family protein [Planctomycetota bacterium]
MPGDEELGSLLVIKGVVTEEQLSEALNAGSETKRSLQRVLVETGVASKKDIGGAVAEDAGVPYIDLGNYLIDPKVADLVSEEVARRHILVPLFRIGDRLTVAMADPTDLVALDKITMSSNCEVEVCVSSEEDVEQAISEGYSAAKEVSNLLQSMAKDEGEQAGAAGASQAPIAKLMDLILTQAVRDKASDIHINPEAETLRVRFRMDGVLYEIPPPPKHLELAIVSRIKVLSDMDIATTRIPQDGHFQAEVDGKSVDVRVSSVPTVHGENLVMRLLVTSDALIGLDRLGFSESCLRQFSGMISRPHGMILTTGPTGSGKTTSLYAALNIVNTVEKNILTIEDPVEYRLPLIRQIQVNPRAGVTFANGLRSILRQDPDIVMVGEIRDLETADIAVQAALTGHLVFSTLHTNDAASTLARLMDLGIAPFLLAASITGVIAQRLIRRLCPKCREEYEAGPSVINSFGLDERGVTLYRAKGCKACKGTGYSGRTGLFEVMEVTESIKDLIVKNAPASAIMTKAKEEGMKPLLEDGVEKALRGETSIEEVARVAEATVDVGRARAVGTVTEGRPAEAPVPVEAAPRGETIDLNDYRQKISNWLAKR